MGRDLITVFIYLQGGYGGDGDELFYVASGDRASNSGLQLMHGKHRMDRGKKLASLRMGKS